jgi:hypothetical protein
MKTTTKKQVKETTARISTELLGKGFNRDRYGNWVKDSIRVKFTASAWRHEGKVDGRWSLVKSHSYGEGTKAPGARVKPAKSSHQRVDPCVKARLEANRKQDKAMRESRETQREENMVQKTALEPKRIIRERRKDHLTPLELAPKKGHDQLQVKVSLEEREERRIEAIAFRQIQTNTRLDVMEKTMEAQAKHTAELHVMMETQLKRIKGFGMAQQENALFCTRMFSKISMRLRKKSIDVTIEDISNGVKRKRIFRCTDWSRVEHLMSYRTETDGIEEISPRVPAKKVVGKKNAGGRHTTPKTLADVRHVMERDGEQNSIVPERKEPYYDKGKETAQKSRNRDRAHAERVITRLCSRGGVAEDAKNGALISALVKTGFEEEVAFYAASNCGRITDPKLLKKYATKTVVTSPAGETSNQY